MSVAVSKNHFKKQYLKAGSRKRQDEWGGRIWEEKDLRRQGFGLDNYLLQGWGTEECGGRLAAPRDSAYQMLAAIPQLWQSKLSPDSSKSSWGGEGGL